MFYTDEPFGPVGVVIPSGHLARFIQFEESFTSLHVPMESERVRLQGMEAICMGANDAVYKTLGRFTHYWFIDDDHEFDARHLMGLLNRNVDIIHGPTISKAPPWRVSFFKDRKLDGTFTPYTFADLNGLKGMIEVFACGRGGLLVHKRVFEKMPRPWFRMGQLDPEAHNEDVDFCLRAKELGFKVHVDLDNVTGHVGTVAHYPHRKKDGTWSVRMMFPGMSVGTGFVVGGDA